MNRKRHCIAWTDFLGALSRSCIVPSGHDLRRAENGTTSRKFLAASAAEGLLAMAFHPTVRPEDFGEC